MIFYFLKKCSEFFYKDFVKFYIECCKFSKDLGKYYFFKLYRTFNLLIGNGHNFTIIMIIEKWMCFIIFLIKNDF